MLFDNFTFNQNETDGSQKEINWKRNFNFTLKNMNSSKSTSKKENVFFFDFISSFVSFGVCRYME